MNPESIKKWQNTLRSTAESMDMFSVTARVSPYTFQKGWGFLASSLETIVSLLSPTLALAVQVSLLSFYTSLLNRELGTWQYAVSEHKCADFRWLWLTNTQMMVRTNLTEALFLNATRGLFAQRNNILGYYIIWWISQRWTVVVLSLPSCRSSDLIARHKRW